MFRFCKTILKYALMLLIFCLLPLWGFLPIALAGALSNWLGNWYAIIIGILFGVWFYGAGIVMIPFDSGFFKARFWDG